MTDSPMEEQTVSQDSSTEAGIRIQLNTCRVRGTAPMVRAALLELLAIATLGVQPSLGLSPRISST